MMWVLIRSVVYVLHMHIYVKFKLKLIRSEKSIYLTMALEPTIDTVRPLPWLV